MTGTMLQILLRIVFFKCLNFVLKNELSQMVVAHTFEPSTLEGAGSLSPGLQDNFLS